MNYINSSEKNPQYVTHRTFYSELYSHEIGYNIYLPPDYLKSSKKYPVAYHFHGWMGDESSEIWIMEKIYSNRQYITVFPNNSPVIEGNENLPVESMIINELIPHIDGNYRTNATRLNRIVSGFSLGGYMAFLCAVKYLELFASVTAYAGTYHHFYYKDYCGVGKPMEKAVEIYKNMMNDDKCFDRDNILNLRQNVDKVRDNLQITLIVGTADPLICDNEIFHLYLNSLNISHDYKKINGVGHELDKII